MHWTRKRFTEMLEISQVQRNANSTKKCFYTSILIRVRTHKYVHTVIHTYTSIIISVLKNNSFGFDSNESDGDLPRHSHHRRGRPFSELRKQVWITVCIHTCIRTYIYIHTYRYGYIGRNGCGKSTFMKVIAARCFPRPDGIDIFHLSEEVVCMFVCMYGILYLNLLLC